jgi:hypothetical protein
MSRPSIDKTPTARRRSALAGAVLAGLFPALVAGLVQLNVGPASASWQIQNQNGGGTNADIYAPNGTATAFTVVLSGDYLPAMGIPPSQGNTGTIYVQNWGDPFCPPPAFGNPCPVTATFSPSANTTTLVYSGTQGLFPNSVTTGYYHFGYVLASGANAYDPIAFSTNWTYVSGSQQLSANVPWLSMKCDCKLAKNSLVAIVYYQSTFVGGSLPVASWNIVSYTPKGTGAQPTIKFANYGAQSAAVYNTGILLGIKPPTNPKGWEQLVSEMNAADMPPPGASGSPFQPLSKPPPKILKSEQAEAQGLQTYRAFLRRR